jgi:16S rRNA processing protein RimM
LKLSNSVVGKDGFLPVGKIVGAHGVKGNLKVHSYAESVSVFKPGRLILAIHAGKVEKHFAVKWAKPHGKSILLSFKGIEDRNTAETLIGAELFIERTALPELEEGVYYWTDIIGLSVFTTDNQYIGRVESIMATGSNDVYVVKDTNKENNNETLIPVIESVVLEIDFEHKRIRVNLPEGL